MRKLCRHYQRCTSGLEQTPPELSADIAQRGILLTGGGSQLYGLEELLEESTGIRTTTVDDPLSVVAIGTGRYAEFIEGMGDLAVAHSAGAHVVRVYAGAGRM